MMRTIGMIGGVSWESSLDYYRIINQEANKRLGGYHSAKCLMYSVDFAEIESLQRAGKWEEVTGIIVEAAVTLERGGADFFIICTNTLHKVAEDIQKRVGIPLIHIVDATALEIKRVSMTKVGLLGTRFTMEENFYKDALNDKYGIEVTVPDKDDRDIIHNIIFNELCFGKVTQPSRAQFIRIINQMAINGAEGVILGCTEIPLLVRQEDVGVMIFNTTGLHAISAVDFALNG